MKKIKLLALCALIAAFFASCGKEKDDYKKFVGTWGVEKIQYEYCNTDFYGNPITGDMEIISHVMDPDDFNNGLHLTFKADKTGEMRDSAIDSLPTVIGQDTVYIQCPDTVIVYHFRYTYDVDEEKLYRTMDGNARIYGMVISNMTANSFEYENNYGKDPDNRLYIEKAWLKRVDGIPAKANSRKANSSGQRPRMPGSFLSGR